MLLLLLKPPNGCRRDNILKTNQAELRKLIRAICITTLLFSKLRRLRNQSILTRLKSWKEAIKEWEIVLLGLISSNNHCSLLREDLHIQETLMRLLLVPTNPGGLKLQRLTQISLKSWRSTQASTLKASKGENHRLLWRPLLNQKVDSCKNHPHLQSIDSKNKATNLMDSHEDIFTIVQLVWSEIATSRMLWRELNRKQPAR